MHSNVAQEDGGSPGDNHTSSGGNGNSSGWPGGHLNQPVEDINASHKGATPILECYATHGGSGSCGQETFDPVCQSQPGPGPAGLPCCTADSGSRYAALAMAFPGHALESLCAQTFNGFLSRLADLAR